MIRETTEAVVVGAGAGGGCAAKVLACAGIKTMLLERGEWAKYDVNGEADLAGQRMPVLVQGPGRLATRTRKCHLHDNGAWGVVKNWNAACVGSGTVTYGAMGWRFMEVDFHLKSHYGEVADASLEDWPITYDDLEPYYYQAECEVGVCGDNGDNPFSSPRKQPFPMPPFALDPESKLMWDVTKKMGLHPFHCSLLRNSVPHNGRPACIHQHFCVGFQCPIDAKNGSQNSVIPEAIKSGNCDLRIRAMVTELLVDDNGKLHGVKYVDENDEVHLVEAKVVVLAAGSNEDARLMLHSTSKLFPHGVGNNHDVVGRNITSHSYVDACGVLDYDLHADAGPGTNTCIWDYEHDNHAGFVLGGMLHTDFRWTPYQFGMRAHPGVPKWGLERKAFIRKNYKRFFRICGPIQQMPRWDNRVVLDPSRKDYWGLPFVKILGYEHPNDYKNRMFLAAKAKEIVEKCGAKGVTNYYGGPSDGPAKWWEDGGQHQSGACRMGLDPKKSVTDKWSRVWDFPNLVMADCSVHVNNGGMNPVLTGMALAFRAAQHIVDTRKEVGL